MNDVFKNVSVLSRIDSLIKDIEDSEAQILLESIRHKIILSPTFLDIDANELAKLTVRDVAVHMSSVQTKLYEANDITLQEKGFSVYDGDVDLSRIDEEYNEDEIKIYNFYYDNIGEKAVKFLKNKVKDFATIRSYLYKTSNTILKSEVIRTFDNYILICFIKINYDFKYKYDLLKTQTTEL